MKKKPDILRQERHPYKSSNKLEKNLFKAFTLLKGDQEVANFLRDLLTLAELEEFSNRLEIAELLLKRELSYLEIAEKVGTSTTTVTRVAQWLFRGCGGYQTVLERSSK
jgi:TrpR-related protein YerC/YecD